LKTVKKTHKFTSFFFHEQNFRLINYQQAHCDNFSPPCSFPRSFSVGHNLKQTNNITAMVQDYYLIVRLLFWRAFSFIRTDTASYVLTVMILLSAQHGSMQLKL